MMRNALTNPATLGEKSIGLSESIWSSIEIPDYSTRRDSGAMRTEGESRKSSARVGKMGGQYGGDSELQVRTERRLFMALRSMINIQFVSSKSNF